MEYAEASYIVDEDVIDTNAVANPITVVVAVSYTHLTLPTTPYV